MVDTNMKKNKPEGGKNHCGIELGKIFLRKIQVVQTQTHAHIYTMDKLKFNKIQ